MADGMSVPSVATQTRRIKRRQAPRREWRKVDVPRRTFQDQFAHGLARSQAR